MDIAVLIKESLRALLLPPGCLLLIITIGWFGRAHLGRWSKYVTSLAIALFWLLSLPVVAAQLMAWTETPALKDPAQLARSKAIVILGGGKRFAAYDVLEQETVNNVTLARVRYGARLARISHLPILVSGGAPLGGASEAHYMKQVLEQDMGQQVKWIEGGSVDTAENAQMSKALLGPAIHTITLVTSADHMARAQRSFEKQGLHVIAAPTDFINREPISPTQFLPRASALLNSSTALREGLGLMWYTLRGQ